jgi:translocation and assembly module TamB
LTLNQFHIAGANTDLTATGAIPLIGVRSMDVSASGAIDLALIQTLNPNFTSAGKVMLNVRAEGTTSHPVLTGRVDVQNASIAYVDLPNGLSEVNGTLIFDQNRLVVQKLTGQSGGGALTLGGYVAYSSGLSFAVTAHVQDMRLRYPPGVSTITNADLRWTGSAAASTVAGDLMLTRFNISPQFDFASYIARAGQPLPAVAVSSPLNNIKLDLHVVSAPSLQVSTSLAKVSGDIDLRIRGTVADPSILGRVNILRGTIFFNGTNYQIQRGDITFLNPTTIEPVLNLEFTTRIAGYDINLSLDGPLDHLHTTYRSDPPLPSSDIISLLAFRQCPTSAEFSCSPNAVEQAETYNTSANPSFTETASNQILGEALNATLSNRVQRLFGISRVKISPEVASTIGNPSARITVEQQVSNNVTITYVTDVAQAQQQVIQVEYNINRNFSIVAVRDQFGVASFDVRIRRRKR